MQFNNQNDIKWKDDIMNEKEEVWKDTLGQYGCLVTSLANIIQIHRNIDFTPQNLNETIKTHKAYWYPFKSQEESNASFLDWDKFCQIFECSVSESERFKKSLDGYHIAKIRVNGNPHYINVVLNDKSIFWCFDVWDGKLKQYSIDDIEKFKQITFTEK